MYDEDYYERGVESGKSLYSNYRWIPELTIPMCSELISQLEIKEDETILDFGCAKGYLVKAFRLLHREAYGIDVSDYAINKSKDNVRAYLDLVDCRGPFPVMCKNDRYDWIIAKDVLEHVKYEDIDLVLTQLSLIGKNIFIAVPLGDGKKYVVDSYELDKTHIIREDLDWWASVLKKNFTVVSMNYKMKHIKENYQKYEKGNGFFILKTK